MEFSIAFLEIFITTLYLVSPILLFLASLIVIFGQIIGRIEGWSISDSLYYSFITATTVGYGDYHPRRGGSKFIAIVIALTGIVLTGIVVSVALKAVGVAFTSHHDIERAINEVAPQIKK